VYKQHLILGKSGEELAVALLEGNGYKILTRNYKTKLGEIDIIARDKDTICFVEVKTRHSDKHGLPQESVQGTKQRQISKTALMYLKENNLLDKKARFDVVSIRYCESTYKLELIKDAFELDESFTY
jgi:putative endonuclease